MSWKNTEMFKNVWFYLSFISVVREALFCDGPAMKLKYFLTNCLFIGKVSRVVDMELTLAKSRLSTVYSFEISVLLSATSFMLYCY